MVADASSVVAEIGFGSEQHGDAVQLVVVLATAPTPPPPPPPSVDALTDSLASSALLHRAASLNVLEAACSASDKRRQQPIRRAKSLLSAKEHIKRYGGEEPRLRGSPFGACYVESFLNALWRRLRGTLPEPDAVPLPSSGAPASSENSNAAVDSAAGAVAVAAEPDTISKGVCGGSDKRSITTAGSSWSASVAGSNNNPYSAFSLSSLQGLETGSEAFTGTQTVNLGSLPGEGVVAALAVAAETFRNRDNSTYEEEGGGDASDAGGSDGASTVQFDDIFPIEVEDCHCRWCTSPLPVSVGGDGGAEAGQSPST